MKAIALLLALLVAVPAVSDEAHAPQVAAVTRAHHKLKLRYFVSGAVLLGVFYTASFVLAIRFEEPELSVPILGPLIDLRRCSGCTASSVEQGVVAGLVLDSVLQAAGASLLIVGARF